MTPHALLFTLAAIGISETMYLIRKRRAQERPVCIIGESCHQVLESKYSRLFGVSNDVLGLVFYVAAAVLTALLVIGVGSAMWWDVSVKLLILGGAVMSAALTYLQWRVLHAWCFWCVMSATTVFLMSSIVLISNLTLLL